MAAIDPRIIIEEFLESHDLEYEKKDFNTLNHGIQETLR
jgi:hypothetical protein